MRIYLINLDRSPERYQYMRRQLQKLNLPYQRIKAVDGQNLQDPVEKGKVANMKRVEEWPNLLTPNAIACALSHAKAYEALISSKDAFGLILEDDVKLSGEIPALLKAMEGKLDDDSVYLVYFHGMNGEIKEFVSETPLKIDNRHCFYKAKTIWGAYSTGGYIISRNLAVKLLDFIRPVHTTSDSWGVYYREGIIKGLWALLPLETATANFASNIDYESSPLRAALKKMDVFKWLYRKYKNYKAKDISAYKIINEPADWP